MTSTPKQQPATDPAGTTEEAAPPAPPDKTPKKPASHVAGLGERA